MADLKDDIEKYLRGEMSASEMHALEKKALDDPFLADALEGASQLTAENFSADLGDLRGRLAKGKPKVVPMWTWIARVAAGLMIVGVITFLVVNRNDKDSEDRIALNNEVKETPKTDSQPTASDTLQKSPERSTPPINGSKNKGRREALKRPANDTEEDSEPVVAERSEADVSDELTDSSNQTVAAAEVPAESEYNAGRKDAVSSDTVLAFKEIPPNAAAKTAKPQRLESSSRYLTGRVLDADDGKGLPGVNVTVKDKSIGTITDEEGRYKLPLDSIGESLTFSFIGYENKEVQMGKARNLDVTLSPDISQLSEVVVVGYGGTKRDDLEMDPIIELAEPAGGRKAYKSYLQQNLRYPEKALNNKIEGRVTVQFTLEASGQMTDFKVLKGLGFGCDEEVIRLIKQGPKWNPSRRNTEPVSDKVKVRLRFSIPKK